MGLSSRTRPVADQMDTIATAASTSGRRGARCHIDWRSGGEQMFEQASLPRCARESDQHARGDGPQRLAQNHRADSLRGGADGDPDADFAAALRDRVRGDAVDSGDGEQQGESAEEEKYRGAEAGHGDRFIEALLIASSR